MRNLLIFILVLIAIWWVRRALQKPRVGQGRRPPGEGRQASAERMQACAHCGVHVPESEGIQAGEYFFCSEAHRKLGARRG